MFKGKSIGILFIVLGLMFLLNNLNLIEVSLAELIIDQSGNNVLIDGELNPQNIIRVDITNSQSGTVNGQFGYSADYFIITYNEPL